MTDVPDYHKEPGITWHAPGRLARWLRDTARNRGMKLSALLNEIVREHILRTEPGALDDGTENQK